MLRCWCCYCQLAETALWTSEDPHIPQDQCAARAVPCNKTPRPVFHLAWHATHASKGRMAMVAPGARGQLFCCPLPQVHHCRGSPCPTTNTLTPRPTSALQAAAAAACAPEQGCVSWQAPLGVEAHAVKLGVVGAARHKRPAAHTAGRLCAVAQLSGQLAGRAVSTHQHAALHLGARCCGDGPQACGLVKGGTSDLQQGRNKSSDLTLHESVESKTFTFWLSERKLPEEP